MCGEAADVAPLDELYIPLFLAWHDMTDHDGALGGHGFMDDGPARLADVEVMGAEELGNLVGPSDQTGSHPVDHSGSRERRMQSLETTGDDGDLGIRELLEFPDHRDGMLGSRRGKEE